MKDFGDEVFGGVKVVPSGDTISRVRGRTALEVEANRWYRSRKEKGH